MKRLTNIAVLSLLACLGCAGSILSHKPYQLRGAMVVEATSKRVLTEWPEKDWHYGSSMEGAYLLTGDIRPNICPETVPAVGSVFSKARMTWQKDRKCWRWESQ